MSPNFTTTHWTVVWAAAGRNADDSDAQRALESFCRSYWTPLYTFVRRRGSEPAAAQDAVQDFFLHLLENRVLAHVEGQQGRFRTYLLRCFCNFLVNQHKKSTSLKRGGQIRLVALEEVETAELDRQAAMHNWAPERAYDIAWAYALIERVVDKLRAEATERGKETWFDEMQAFLPRGRETDAEGPDKGQDLYQRVAGRLSIPVETLRTSVHRLRARFRELARAEVARTVETPDETDAEFQHLRTTLSLAYQGGQ